MGIPESSIVFFDGVCSLCNGFVDFLIRQDREKRLTFASLQGETAAKLFDKQLTSELQSIIFWDRGKVYQESEAVLMILSRIGGIWSFLHFLRFIPKEIRDRVYRFISKNRYVLFGKRETCRVPSADERTRFQP